MVLAQNDVCATVNYIYYCLLVVVSMEKASICRTQLATRVAVLHNIHNITYLHTQNMTHYTHIYIVGTYMHIIFSVPICK